MPPGNDTIPFNDDHSGSPAVENGDAGANVDGPHRAPEDCACGPDASKGGADAIASEPSMATGDIFHERSAKLLRELATHLERGEPPSVVLLDELAPVVEWLNVALASAADFRSQLVAAASSAPGAAGLLDLNRRLETDERIARHQPRSKGGRPAKGAVGLLIAIEYLRAKRDLPRSRLKGAGIQIMERYGIKTRQLHALVENNRPAAERVLARDPPPTARN